jgi:hypothetical protein
VPDCCWESGELMRQFSKPSVGRADWRLRARLRGLIQQAGS